jgi:hypothetical protein
MTSNCLKFLIRCRIISHLFCLPALHGSSWLLSVRSSLCVYFNWWTLHHQLLRFIHFEFALLRYSYFFRAINFDILLDVEYSLTAWTHHSLKLLALAFVSSPYLWWTRHHLWFNVSHLTSDQAFLFKCLTDSFEIELWLHIICLYVHVLQF